MFALVLLLGFMPFVSGLAVQQKVGRLVAPVEFGAIHFVRGPDDLAAVLRRNQARATHLEDIAADAPEPFKRRFKELAEKLTRKQDRQRADIQEIAHLLAADKKEKRSKRVAPLIVGAGAVVAGVGALAVVSLGFGVASQYQLASLGDRVDALKTGEEKLMERLEEHAERAQRNFGQLNASLSALQWEMRLTEERTVAGYEARFLDEAVRDYIAAAYHTLSGLLHPAFVSPEELREGLQRMEDEAAPRGMRPVLFERPMEAFFSMPVSALLNGTGLHLYVSVPMVPIAAPDFEVLRLIAPPMALGRDVFLELLPEKDLLVIDQRRELHAEMSAADLAACHRFQGTFFCGMATFQRGPRSCAAALLNGDKVTAGGICRKRVLRRPAVVLPASNDSSAMDVWTAEAQTVVTLCPGGQEQQMQRVEGRQRVVVGPGCVLRTSTTTTFQASRLPEVQVATQVPHWIHEELLEGVEAWEVADYMAAIPLEDVAVEFGHVRASVSADRRWGPVKAGLIFMGCMLGLVGGGLFLRYLSLWYKVRKERVGSTDIQE